MHAKQSLGVLCGENTGGKKEEKLAQRPLQSICGQTSDEGGGQSGDVLGTRKGEGWVIIYKGAGVREAVSNGPWFLIRQESSSVNLCYIVNEKVNEELA